MVRRITAIAVLTLALSCLLPLIAPHEPAPFLAEKRQAVRLAAEARARIGERLLGEDFTDTTTTIGHKDAKTLSAAPDFPALLVAWLKAAHIGPGSTVAINASGSFPALTIAALSAVNAVGARPLLISSLGASSWGANRPDFTWLHMERELVRTWPEYASIAVSLGGGGDMAGDLSEEGRAALLRATAQTGAPLLEHENQASIVASRIAMWQRHNDGRLPDFLINTGGNLAYWGERERDQTRPEGLLLPGPGMGEGRNGVGDIFLREGKPVVHLLGIRKLAAHYRITIPPSPDSPLWVTTGTALWFRLTVAALLAGIMALLVRLRPEP